MILKNSLDELEEEARRGGFLVERDETFMFIKKHGFGYHFKTDVDEESVRAMIYDAETFMRDIRRMKE